MRRERILATLTGGFAAELVNKLVPLFLQSFAIARLGVGHYGAAQFSYSLVDVAITLVVAGYAQLAVVELGQSHGERTRIRGIISEVTILKLAHAVLASAGLIAALFLVKEWHEHYLNLTLPLLILVFTSALDMSFVHIGTARMLPLSLITILTKLTSLGLILLLVRGPDDLLVFTLLYFGINGVIAGSNCVLNLRLFSFAMPAWSALRERFLKSLPFALPVFLLMALERYDLFFVEHLLGPTGAGLYGGTVRYVQAVSSLVVAVSTVFFSELVATRDREAFTSHVNLGLWVVFALLLPAAVGAYFLGSPLLSLVLPGEFAAMGGVFAILITALIAHALILVYGLQVLMYHKRAWVINGVLAGCVGLGLLLSFALRERFGMAGIATANLLSRSSAALLFLLCARGYVERLPLRELLLTGGPALGMGAALWLVREQSLVVQLPTACLLYAVLLAACNRTKVARVWAIVQSRRV